MSQCTSGNPRCTREATWAASVRYVGAPMLLCAKCLEGWKNAADSWVELERVTGASEPLGAIHETINRWARVTGDGSMWGDDAYVLGPIRDASGDPLSDAERASGAKWEDENAKTWLRRDTDRDADRAAVRALVDALPRCGHVPGCEVSATRELTYAEHRERLACDEHSDSTGKWMDLDEAPALRALLKRMKGW